jgi:tetratricopeptide (TPR) repeat protein
MAEPPSLFISYSHVDREWKDKLAVHLGVLAREDRLAVWEDSQIAAGDEWFPTIEQAIRGARVAVLLVSAEFLISNFIYREEIPRLLLGRQTGSLRLIPILVRPCAWKEVEWLANLQMRPVDGREISAGSTYQIEKDFAAIAEEIGKLIGTKPAPRANGPAVAVSSTVDLSALPATGQYFFGRENELVALDKAWARPSINIVSLVAWGGAGKSALVNHWLGKMELEDYRGADRAFGWSFFSQGTKETETSADEFFKAALAWFGDTPPPAGSSFENGERLAALIQCQRVLLVLDGLEPLQNPPGVESGKVKDPALAELLRHLENHNPGLCLITTRIEVADIADRRETTAPVVDLGRLSTATGSALLTAIGVKGEPEELIEAVEAVEGHALSLNLLGSYIRDILDRNVNRWREAGLLEAARQGDQRALQVMEAYERWFAGRPELAILRILGLFDRPARRELVDVLRRPPVVAGLNDELVNLPENEWRWALARLRQARLIEGETGGVIDAHPLVREHFRERLKAAKPEAWRAGHARLYELLRDSAKPLPDTLAEMAPLFQAMHHGCQAGRHQEALEEVYVRRIQRGGESYNTKKLGAIGAELSAIAGLFEPPWDKPVAVVTEDWQAFILNEAAFDLHALGRLREAVAPMRAGLERYVERENWDYAARVASNLSELHLALGDVAEAVAAGEASVEHADRSGDAFLRVGNRTAWADALHQAGEAARARALFEEAETLQAERQPEYPRLYPLWGSRYCDLLLAQGRAAGVRERAEYASDIAEKSSLSLLTLALDHLSLGRAALALGEHDKARAQLDKAVDGLRQAGDISYLPRGLLAQAALFREIRDFPAARRDLDEAMRIARRGEMRLFQCDAHLEYARLAIAEGDRETARKELAEAKRLVEETGYGRRRPEVEALEAEIGKLEGRK